MLGLTLYGLSLILTGFSQNFLQLIIFRVLQGVGLGIFGPASLGLVAQVKEKGRGFAFYRTANSLGLMLAPVIGGIVGNINLTYPFILGGLISLSAITSIFHVHDLRNHEPRREKFLSSLRGIGLTKKIILMRLATFAVELAFASLEIVVPLFGSGRGLSLASIGIVLSSYFIAFTLFQIPIGIVSEKINRKALIIICSFAGALQFILLSYCNDVAAMSLSLGALGVTLGTVFVQSSALIADVAPEDEKSLYMAFFDSIIDYSFVVGPLITTYALTCAPIAPFIICTFPMITAGIIFMKA